MNEHSRPNIYEQSYVYEHENTYCMHEQSVPSSR